MDVDEEDDVSDEVDSIMDEDEPESSRAEDGGETTLTWTVPSFAKSKKLLSTRVTHASGFRSPSKPSAPPARLETSRKC
jgi:hypothetical protein